MPTADIDWKVSLLVNLLLANKSHTIFTFLFGVGFAIIIERASRTSESPSGFLLRRMLVLLVIGWLHFLMLYSGEEVHVYAICGFALIALRHMSDRALLVSGLLLAVLPRLVHEEWDFVSRIAGITVNQEFRSGGLTPEDGYALVSAGASHFQMNLRLALVSLSDVPRSLMYLLYFLGKILLGFVAWRSGYVRRLLGANTSALIKLTLLVGTCSIALTLITAFVPEGQRSTLHHFAYNFSRQTAFIALAAFYLLAITTACRIPSISRALSPLASIGRMSLTSYITQSLLLMWILTGPGMRLGGQIGAAPLALIAVGAYCCQVLVSDWWISRFRRGPVEWLWRRLASWP